MTERHSLFIPPKILQQLRSEAPVSGWHRDSWIADRAAQWGWDQREDEIQAAADAELEACCEWLANETPESYIKALRAARRPKPPTLNSIALQMLGTIECDAHYLPEITDTIRKALEQLND
jgi:hypothetical protein